MSCVLVVMMMTGMSDGSIGHELKGDHEDRRPDQSCNSMPVRHWYDHITTIEKATI